MSEDGEKPSYEAQQDLAILGITFALANEVIDSIKESKKKTEIWTLSERLKSVAEMSPIPKLTKSNWRHWQESVQTLLSLSDISSFIKGSTKQ